MPKASRFSAMCGAWSVARITRPSASRGNGAIPTRTSCSCTPAPRGYPYNPSSGTFLSRDPFAGYDTLPYSLHPYQYGYSSPLVNTDHSGRCPECEYGPLPPPATPTANNPSVPYPPASRNSIPSVDKGMGAGALVLPVVAGASELVGGAALATVGGVCLAVGAGVGIGYVTYRLLTAPAPVAVAPLAPPTLLPLSIYSYTVSDHAYGRPNHGIDEADVRATVALVFEWWKYANRLWETQELYLGLAGPASGPIAVVKYNKTRNTVNDMIIFPTLVAAHKHRVEKGYIVGPVLSPLP